jgi:hypothetical protein
MSFKMTEFPTVPRGRAAIYELCPLFRYCFGYYEVYRHFHEGFFSGWGGAGGGGYSGKSFRGRCFLGVRDISMKGAPDFQHYLKTIRN